MHEMLYMENGFFFIEANVHINFSLPEGENKMCRTQ